MNVATLCAQYTTPRLSSASFFAAVGCCGVVGLLSLTNIRGFGVSEHGSEYRTAPVVVNMQHTVDGVPLRLDSATYRNVLGQPYTVTAFRYYVGQFTLERADGSIYTPRGYEKTYFLVDEEQPTTKLLTLPRVAMGTYTAVHFTWGIDSVLNVSGAQHGALDPTRGMFWSWNAGYIFMKLEGTSPASSAHGRLLEYHVGGFRAPANCVRHVRIALPKPLMVGGHEAAAPKIQLRADIARLFGTPNATATTTIDFAKIPVVGDFRHAEEVANNAATMWSSE